MAFCFDMQLLTSSLWWRKIFSFPKFEILDQKFGYDEHCSSQETIVELW